MRIFIFGIGGTGSRVLRSLTMLLASGVKLNGKNLTIVPIIIDTDAHNGDTSRTRDLLRSYYNIRSTFVNKNTTSESESFFNTEIRSFNRLDNNNTSDSAELDVQFNFQNQDNSFANFINYNGLTQNNKDLIELLYNDSLDDHPELHLNLSVGFKGNPNIGSVVFNDLMFSQQFKNLESSFTANDRVFIVSSIFGGTGSSGFPTLVKLIRTSTNNNLAETKIGAITVMPYFNVDSDDKSAINSAIFDTKTKAALSFYAADSHINSIDALYYIADNSQSGCLPNVEGGVEQKNDSHIIELLSSTAILDFINKEDKDLEIPKCFEFGAEANGIPFNISHFSKSTKERYIAPLVRFAYAAKIATDFIPELTKETFYSPKELNIGGQLGIPNEYKKIIDFFTEFKKWTTEEMSSKNNGRSFNSFNFDDSDSVNNLIEGKVIKTGFLDKGLSKSKISEMLNKHETGKDLKDLLIPERYISMLYKTASDCLKELGQLP
jgi:hypothetical protein